MRYNVQFQGSLVNDELRDKLMVFVRDFVRRVGSNVPVQVAVKQVDDLMESRVELALSKRTISAVVLRKDPVMATRAAIDALTDIVTAM